MLADAGDYVSARKVFEQARRADPASVSLSHLEITLLMSQDRQSEARERARFWAHRLSARRNLELEGMIAFMREITEHGGQALIQLMLDNEPDLQELAALLQSAPRSARNTRFHPVRKMPLRSSPSARCSKLRVVGTPWLHR